MYGTSGICFYPGNFNPPTKYHLKNALWLQANSDINQVVILVGDERNDVISSDSKKQIWDLYIKTNHTGRITVEKSKEGSSFRHLLNLLDKSSNTIYVALDENSAKSTQINTLFQGKKNVEYIIIPSNYDAASKRMLEYLKSGDDKKFNKILPDNISQAQIIQIKNLISSSPEEEKDSDIKEVYSKMFDIDFWKSSIPIEEAKNVGDIYHFTDIKGLSGIIDSEYILKSGRPSDLYNETEPGRDYISFTRNKNMHRTSWIANKTVRIKVDGSGMSNQYKFEPYADTVRNWGRSENPETDQSEERVKDTGKGVDIKNHIKVVEILVGDEVGKYGKEYIDVWDDLYKKDLRVILTSLKKDNIPTKLVRTFK